MKKNIVLWVSSIILAILATVALVALYLKMDVLHKDLNRKEVQIDSIHARLDSLESNYAFLRENFDEFLYTIPEENPDSNLLLAVEEVIEEASKKTEDKLVSKAPPSPPVSTTALGAIKGATLKNGPSFDVFKVDPKKTDLAFYHRDGNQVIGSIQTLNSLLKRQSKKLVFATNGGMFEQNLSPTGLFVANGQELYPLNLRKGGNSYTNFYSLPPNGVFYVTKGKTAGIVKKENYPGVSSNIEFATQSGPMVVINGKINPNFNKGSNSKFTRSGVGIRKDGTIVFAISQQPVTFYDFARIFLFYGCQDALYLDGAISEMYLPEIGRNQSANRFALLIAVTRKCNRMKLKILFFFSISILLLSPSCTTLYQKSALSKSQEGQLKKLDQENQNLEKELGDLQQQLAEAKAAKDTIRIILPPAEVWKEDSTAIITIDSTINAIAKDSTIIVVVDSTKTMNEDSIALAHSHPASFLDSLLRIEGHAVMRLGYKKATFDILILEDANEVQLFWKNGKNVIGSLSQLKKLAEKENKQLLFATNAGMYTPSRSPQGIYVEHSEELVPLDTIEEAYGNFYMQPNGVFLIEKSGIGRVVTTEDYEKYKKEVLYATQSGPMAVVNGQINSHFNEGSPNVHIRSGVGIDPQGRTIFLISNQRVNLHTFGSIFKDVFQCQNALYLDGAISQMYLPGLGRNELGGDFGPLIGVLKEENK